MRNGITSSTSEKFHLPSTTVVHYYASRMPSPSNPHLPLSSAMYPASCLAVALSSTADLCTVSWAVTRVHKLVVGTGSSGCASPRHNCHLGHVPHLVLMRLHTPFSAVVPSHPDFHAKPHAWIIDAEVMMYIIESTIGNSKRLG